MAAINWQNGHLKRNSSWYMSKVIDIFTYNGEAAMLEIRLNILDKYVDQFIIVESPLTFSGKEKNLYFELQREEFSKWLHKIKYFIVDEDDPELWEMARNSPNTQGAEHWKREFVQKESIKKALIHLNDNDICFVGDVDEIWEPAVISISFHTALKLKLDVYTYFLNNRSSEEFWGTIITTYGFLKDKCLNHLRTTDAVNMLMSSGWHFTSMGGFEALERKLSDSYTRESYWTPEVEQKLSERLNNNQDFLGRNFTYTLDESELPEYLIQNKEKWIRLFR